MSDKSKQAQATLENHLREFFRKNVDGIVQDYAEDAVLIVPSGPLRGTGEIRAFFTAFIETMPAGFLDSFKLQRQDIVGEIGYIVWNAAPWVQFATDTFVLRNGKITTQTFAAHPPSW